MTLQAAHQLNQLSAKYMEMEAKAKKAKAVVGQKRTIEEDSLYTSSSDPSDEDDSDDDDK